MKTEQAKRLEVFLKKAESTNARIAYDTEKYRKGDGHLTVTDKNGKAIAGARVLLSQKKHEFSFGCNCFMLDSMETPEKNAAYKEYIKKVASSEIYATWPDATLRANILAIMSFTLNRVYTEW